jgi:long-chain fatty acid transport protein
MIKIYAMKKYSLLVLLLVISFAVLAQNGTKLIGYDAKTIGRGGTSVGVFDAGSLIMSNPAGLSFIHKRGLDISFALMTPKTHFTNDINNADGKQNYFPLGAISYVGKQQKKLTYGFGVFTQGGMGADFQLNHSLYKDGNGNFVPQSYHSKFAVMHAGVAASWKLSDILSVGATASLVYGQVAFQMPMSMSPVMLKGVVDPTSGYTYGDMFSGVLGYNELVASAEMKGLTAWQFNGRIGVAFKPTDRFSFGVNYILPVTMRFKKGTANMDMKYQMNDAFGKVVAGIIIQHPEFTPVQAQQAAMDQFNQMGIDLTRGAADVYGVKATFGLPQSVSGGVSYKPGNKLLLSADVEWTDWSHAFDQMDLAMTAGTNPNINKMMGTTGDFSMAFPLEWKNTVVIRTGVEYIACSLLTVRAGYVYGNNPVPAETVFPVFPAIVRHHYTLGSAINVGKNTTINLAYEHAYKSRQQASVISHVGSQYNNSTSTLWNDIFHASFTWNW